MDWYLQYLAGIHLLAGVMWIGLLYYFNFVNVAAAKRRRPMHCRRHQEEKRLEKWRPRQRRAGEPSRPPPSEPKQRPGMTFLLMPAAVHRPPPLSPRRH